MGNVINEDVIAGNNINTLSDHLSQFLILLYNSIMSNEKFSYETLKIPAKIIFFQNSKK